MSWKGRVEIHEGVGGGMALDLPAVLVDLPDGISSSDAVKRFLDLRPDVRCVMLGGHAVQSRMQLITAWIHTTRNELRGSMVARSVDAEFLRYLAGTHHVSEAFARAGVQNEQRHAWLVYLPLARGQANELGHLQPEMDHDQTSPRATLLELAQSLDWRYQESNMHFSIEGALQLGIDVDAWVEGREEESLVAHIMMADDQSSSYR